MDPSESKKKERPRKIDQHEDDVRVILEDQSQGSSEDAPPFLGLMKGALWT